MDIKIEFDLGLHRKHTRDEYFSIQDLRRELILQNFNDNKFHIHIHKYDHLGVREPIDISAWKFYFTCKNLPTDSDDDAIYKNDTLSEITDAVDGEVTMDINLGSGQIDSGNYIYSLKAKDDKGKFRTLCFGCLCIQQAELGTRE